MRRGFDRMSDDVTNPIRRISSAHQAGAKRGGHLHAVVTEPEAPAAPTPRRPGRALSGVPPAIRGPADGGGSGGAGPRGPGRRRGGGGYGGDGGDGGGGRRPRVRKLRLLLILLGLAILAIISTVFGMVMAVASDIPQIENQQEYRTIGDNSYLYDDHWRPIGPFLSSDPEVIDTWKRISPAAIDAVISVEDKRFWSDPGVDIKGIARALLSDISGGATQGASTITEQFVKNALEQQGNRTILEKLREAALAFHLTRRWRRTKILTEYLNSVYFGNGAYGIESAARVYFGKQLGYDPNAATDGGRSSCGDLAAHLPSCAERLTYWQAALLAGMIANPSAFNPIEHPRAAIGRRNLVLLDMLEQRYITRRQYEYGRRQPPPTSAELLVPSEPSAAPYFASWVAPQIIHALERSGMPAAVAQYKAYYGGMKIRTTLDLKMQAAADQAIEQELPYSGPNSPVASLVTIDNATGEVRAMVGGPIVDGHEDYSRYPFNLATEAERQPGSALKPFTLAVALEHGFGPGSVFESAPLDIVVPHSGGREIFHVRNFGNQYSGPITLQEATDVSDNSVFERLGWYALGPQRGVEEIARLENAAGITTPISRNPAMILGGLTIGVSPLDMAHAYETIADGGRRAYNPTLGSPDEGPTGIAEIRWSGHTLRDVPTFTRVMPAGVAQEVHNMLAGVVQSGTGTAAAIAGVDVVGKTGTTTNEADAWFVGWTPQLTTAVWVGFPNKLVPMLTLFNGGPVEGGTFPALIWHSFMVQALQILASEQPAGTRTTTTATTASAPSTLSPAPATTVTPTATAPTTTTATTTTAAPAAPNGNGGAGAPSPAQAPPPATTAPANQNGGTGTSGTRTTGGGTGAGSGTGGGTGGGGTGGGGGSGGTGGTPGGTGGTAVAK
jgi:penicillin-binding protein 1A